MKTPKPIKRGLTIVLMVLTYTVGTLGLFTTYYTYYHRQAFQSEVRKTPAAGLEKLYFSLKEYSSLKWYDDRTEFEWQGRMYDVAGISKEKNGYSVLCKNDALEEMLLSFIESAKGDRHQDTKRGNPQPQYLSPHFEIDTSQKWSAESLPLSMWQSLYVSVPQPISSPPPRG